MGVVILPLMGLYFVLLIVATCLGWRFAEKNGWKKHWLGAVGGFLIIYLPVLGDWIPTVLTHKYYCATEAGFWEYKTLEQWKAENPGVFETLVDNNRNRSQEGISPDWPKENLSGTEIASINQRFGLIYRDHLSTPLEGELLFHTWRWTSELVDKKTGEVLARSVDFSTGNGRVGGEPPLKFWLQNAECENRKNQSQQIGKFIQNFKGYKK